MVSARRRTRSSRRLLDRRWEFLSRLAGDSFGKYGLAQLHRIRTHRRWLLSPPKGKPERASYGLPERSTIPQDALATSPLPAQSEMPGN